MKPELIKVRHKRGDALNKEILGALKLTFGGTGVDGAHALWRWRDVRKTAGKTVQEALEDGDKALKSIGFELVKKFKLFGIQRADYTRGDVKLMLSVNDPYTGEDHVPNARIQIQFM